MVCELFSIEKGPNVLTVRGNQTSRLSYRTRLAFLYSKDMIELTRGIGTVT